MRAPEKLEGLAAMRHRRDPHVMANGKSWILREQEWNKSNMSCVIEKGESSLWSGSLACVNLSGPCVREVRFETAKFVFSHLMILVSAVTAPDMHGAEFQNTKSYSW